MSDRFFEVGKIVNTHGVKGELKILSVTDFPEERYKKGMTLYLGHPSVKESIPVTVEFARLHKNTYIIKLKEFNNINEVEKYKGGSLKVPEDHRFELEEDEFYYDEIMGCEAWSDQGEKLGIIGEILTTGANDVWVVKREKGKDILLPYIEDCILEVHVDEKKVIVHVMEGLME